MDKIDYDKIVVDNIIRTWLIDNDSKSSIDHPWLIMSRYRNEIENTIRAEAKAEALRKVEKILLTEVLSHGSWEKGHKAYGGHSFFVKSFSEDQIKCIISIIKAHVNKLQPVQTKEQSCTQ